jgi:aminoglycoside 6'-N-acetyltransferase
VRDLPGKRVVLRPLSEADASVLRAIHSTPEVTAWWGSLGDDFPLSDDPDATRFTIVCGEEIAGLIQHGEELEPDYRYAWIDIFIDPPRQRRGVGTDAIATLVRYLIEERGHHRITIDPAADNEAAIRCYRNAGFRRVGVMEAAWRDSATGRWRDALLMEFVVRPRERRSGEVAPTTTASGVREEQ